MQTFAVRSPVSMALLLAVATPALAQVTPPAPPAPPPAASASSPAPAPTPRPAGAPARGSFSFSNEFGVNVASDVGVGVARTFTTSPEFRVARSFNLSSSRGGADIADIPDFPDAQSFSSGQWQSQEPDPADSLYRVAYDAMNRGEWRRAADGFAQVTAKFPKSRRVTSASYYEAFMHYRIGTTEELRTALRVLSERPKPTGAMVVSNTTNQEIASLTTRIRGALAARGDAESARLLSSEAQKTGCDAEDVQVKSEALSALAQADFAAATPMLRRVLEKRDPCLLELRRRSLSILLRRGDTAATSAAIAVARATDESVELRTDAISYLSRLPGDNAISTLEELLRSSTDRDVQRSAIRALSNTDNARARQTLRTLIERSDVSEQLRIEAINTMERDPGNGRTDDATYLRTLYPKLQAERLKIAAIAAVSKAAGAENEQFVLRIARDANESSEVRASAISRMYRLPGVSVAELGKLYDAAESRAMREQIINVLGQRKEPETLDKLFEIAKSGTDPRLKSQAVNALMRKDDPRAKKMLSDLVGN